MGPAGAAGGAGAAARSGAFFGYAGRFYRIERVKLCPVPSEPIAIDRPDLDGPGQALPPLEPAPQQGLPGAHGNYAAMVASANMNFLGHAI